MYLQRSHFSGFNLTISILVGFLILYISYPLLGLAYIGGSINWVESLTRPETIHAFLLSLGTATVSTLILSIFGIPLSYALARFHFRFKFLLRLVVILPLVLPPLASGTMLLGVFGPYSFLGRTMPLDYTQSVLGIIIAQTYVASPFIILPSQAAFEAIPERFETMARVLGKRKSEVFIRVSLPLAKTGILVGLLMAWIRSIGELGATLMMAYNPHTISIQIFEDNAIGGIRNSVAGIVWVVILSIIALGVFLYLKRSRTIGLGW
ncbi:MAG: ABC transporter permease subunit [Nitrososphaeraceae archaeon]